MNRIIIFRPQTKLWLCEVKSAILQVNKRWSVQLQEIDTVLIIVKKHGTLMLVTSIQTACSKCPQAVFACLEPFAERQYCCINLDFETSQLRSLAQRS